MNPARDTSFAVTTTALPADLSGMRVIIVGGTGGLGRALSRCVATRGATVHVVGQTFRDSDLPNVTFTKADLSLMRVARSVARELPVEQCDAVVFTTGIFAAPKRQETSEGLELDMAVSYLNRLVMMREIAPRLGKDKPAGSPKPRVFVMGFPGVNQKGVHVEDLNAKTWYSAMPAHMNTVAGNEMLVLDSVKRYPDVNVYGLNPGMVKTNIRANFLGEDSFTHRFVEGLLGLFTPTPETYAERIAPLLFAPELNDRSGAMFNKYGQPARASPVLVDDPAHVAAFIKASEALVAEHGGD